LSRVWSARRTP